MTADLDYNELLGRYDQLGVALMAMEDLDDFAAALRLYPSLLAGMAPGDPELVRKLAYSNTYQALADVAEEVLRLKEETQNG